MALAAIVLALIPALDGESVTSSNTGLAIISLVSMAFGYALLFALWWFVFREKAREKRRGKRD